MYCNSFETGTGKKGKTLPRGPRWKIWSLLRRLEPSMSMESLTRSGTLKIKLRPQPRLLNWPAKCEILMKGNKFLTRTGKLWWKWSGNPIFSIEHKYKSCFIVETVPGWYPRSVMDSLTIPGTWRDSFSTWLRWRFQGPLWRILRGISVCRTWII